MAYLKFDISFLNSLSLTSAQETTFDAVCQNKLKSYLLDEASFAEDSTSLAKAKSNIEKQYDYFIGQMFPIYTEAKRLTENKTHSLSRSRQQIWGTETREDSYFEPVVSGAQAQIKTTGSQSSFTPDGENELISESESNVDRTEVLDFFYNLDEKVFQYFSKYVNTLCFGGD